MITLFESLVFFYLLLVYALAIVVIGLITYCVVGLSMKPTTRKKVKELFYEVLYEHFGITEEEWNK